MRHNPKPISPGLRGIARQHRRTRKKPLIDTDCPSHPRAANERRATMWQHTPLPPGPANAVPDLVLQLLAWVDRAERSYDETMEAWRTSCPRLSVWEDAVDAGLIEIDPVGAAGFGRARVRLTPSGAASLASVARA
jgi:hypothetical protein